MRAITVRQPWAWAIIHGGKDVENRSRNIAGAYRGPVAIHAGLGVDPGARDVLSRLSPTWSGDPKAHPDGQHPWIRGAIVGVVDLVDVHAPGAKGDEPCSPWAMGGLAQGLGYHHLHLRNPRPLAQPIPYRGALGLWTVPDEILAGAL